MTIQNSIIDVFLFLLFVWRFLISPFTCFSFLFLKYILVLHLSLFRFICINLARILVNCNFPRSLWCENVDFLHHSIVYDASIRNDVDCLQLVFRYSIYLIYICTLVSSDDVMIVCKENHTDKKSMLQYIRYKYTVLLTQYCSGDKIRRMRWAGHVARMGERRGVHRVLVGET